MSALLAAIPPPTFGEFHLGPLTVRMYGIMIGLGVLAGAWLGGKLLVERHVGDNEDAAAITVWAVAAGVVGSRLYHVVTNFDYFRDNLSEIPMIWEPGLGIPGGILFGAIAGIIVARRRGVPVLAGLSCAAPALPLAQSIGRWGNYFNQELYGRPTTLPWGLKVDAAHRIAGDGPDVLYHPTFLYESLWNLGLCLVLLWVFRHVRLQPGRLFALYLVGYGSGRLWIESLRIDPANTIGPFRVNIWMSLLLIAVGVVWFVGTRNSTAHWPQEASTGAATTGSHKIDHTNTGDEDHDATPVAGTPISASAHRGPSATSRVAKSGSNDGTADDGAGQRDRGQREADGADVDRADRNPEARGRDAVAGGTDRGGDAVSTRADPSPLVVKPDAETTAAKESSATQQTVAAKPAAPESSVKRLTAKKTTPTKSAAKRTGATKSTVKKTAASTSPAKKPAAKKAGATKSAAKKLAAKKAGATKSAAKKSPPKKAAAKKSAAKKAGATKPAAKKAAAKKLSAKKTAVKQSAAKKAALKKSTAAKKTASKQSSAKKTASKKAAAKKSAAKKSPPNKAAAKKSAAKKSTAKKSTAK